MPNHISNIITFIGSDAEVINALETIKGENGEIDFDKIIPCPESLNIRCSSWGDYGLEYLKAMEKSPSKRTKADKEAIRKLDGMKEADRKECIELGEKYYHNLKAYGMTTWYDWNRWNWGTKWNAYDIFCDGVSICFNTAWNAPLPIFRKLGHMFPDLKIEFVYADEDYGYNTGVGYVKGDEFVIGNPEGGSDDAMKLYFETHPEDEDRIKKVNGEWVWVDDDYDEEAFLEAQSNEAETLYFNS